MSEVYDANLSLGHSIFDHAQLGDKRRNHRLAELFDAMKRNPGGSLPDKFADPADLRAFYRLCDSPDVTHAALIAAIRKHTLSKMDACPGRVLIIHDATELNYSTLKSLVKDLAQLGNGVGRGYICQNVIAVNADTGEVLGLLDQILHRRAKTPKKETKAQLRARDTRESLLWLKGTKHLADDTRLIDVCDRGADTFEFLEHECKSGRRFVIRSCKTRKVHAGHDTSQPQQFLADYAHALPEAGRFTMDVQAQKGRKGDKDKARPPRKARKDAEFSVQCGALMVCRPHVKTGNHGNAPLAMYVVRVIELDPPAGEKPVEWTLLTNEPVKSFRAAWRVIHYYERRWIIEEFHKGMKTGCKIEDIQFTTVDRLQPAIALLSTLALTLLNLRDMSRLTEAKFTPAVTWLDEVYVIVLSLWRFKKIKELTVHEFFYALARLGGHQNRSSDHQPGWIVIWRGWAKLQHMIHGYHAAQAMTCGKT